jgi:site-specific DNA-methyltransferase (adenine-specific)
VKFTSETAVQMGRRGGQATTSAKRRAARLNGLKRRKPHALFSSRTEEWATPPDLYAALDAEFGFTLDPCATPENTKCITFYTKADDGLRKPWSGHVFMNPPYGKTIGLWMAKAWEESRLGALVVCLVPARTDTAWWHSYATRGEVRFLRGRLRFGGASSGAPFPSAVVVFRP